MNFAVSSEPGVPYNHFQSCFYQQHQLPAKIEGRVHLRLQILCHQIPDSSFIVELIPTTMNVSACVASFSFLYSNDHVSLFTKPTSSPLLLSNTRSVLIDISSCRSTTKRLCGSSLSATACMSLVISGLLSSSKSHMHPFLCCGGGLPVESSLNATSSHGLLIGMPFVVLPGVVSTKVPQWKRNGLSSNYSAFLRSTGQGKYNFRGGFKWQRS